MKLSSWRFLNFWIEDWMKNFRELHLIQHHLQFRLGLWLQFSLQVQHLWLQRCWGGMSDVGSTLTPPELPLRDPSGRILWGIFVEWLSFWNFFWKYSLWKSKSWIYTSPSSDSTSISPLGSTLMVASWRELINKKLMKGWKNPIQDQPKWWQVGKDQK